MDRPQIHYEVTTRRGPAAGFTLQGACESRAQAIELAEELLADGRAVQVRVSKEVMLPDSGEFTSVVVFDKGDPQVRKARKPAAATSREASPCTSPQDLYNLHSRETIGRVLADWLARNRVTVSELIHRADLLEQLEASGLEIQGAIQKVAVAEAQGAGRSLHEIIRGYQGLTDRAIGRVRKDAERGAFPVLELKALEPALTAVGTGPEAAYRLGGGVAMALAAAVGWDEKLDALLDLAEASLLHGEAGAPLLAALERPLAEMLETRAGLRDLLGVEGDFGDDLGALTRLVAAAEIDALTKVGSRISGQLPPLEGAALRLARFFEAGAFVAARRAVGRRIVRELSGPRRLHAGDPAAEIETLRALATALTATGARLVDPDDVRRAFVERSRGMLGAEFVNALVKECAGSPLAELQRLVWLAENVAGPANKRVAARMLAAALGAHRIEDELVNAAEPPAARLVALARLQREVAAAGFQDEDAAALSSRLGELGGVIEARVKLIAALVRVEAEPAHKLILLAKLASGESAPTGPVTTRARAEVLRLMRRPESREPLAASPELRERLAALLPIAA